MRRTTGGISFGLILVLALSAMAAPSSELRPKPRPVAKSTRAEQAAPRRNARFEGWVRAFRQRALKQGISPAVFDRAFAEVRYNPKVIEKDRNQAEFTRQIWEYLDSATSPERVRNGKAMLRKHRALLRRIERRYKVDAKVVLAIWGLESAYGTHMGTYNVIEALATLAFDSRRGRFFEQQLITALKIAQAGDKDPRGMTGSWAGAMGHTQFIPTSYMAFAQDFTGDGRRDIWEENPADALASTANYLAQHGWTYGQPWGLEVRLPGGFDYAQTGERVKKSVAEWQRMGVTTIDGKALPDHGPASILTPAGAKGPAFLIFSNFHVLERYNAADAYVIAVGHLGDRIMGGPPIRHSWPRGEKALSFAQKKQMQRLLRSRGFDVEKIDGIVGPNTIAAIRAFQASIGLEPDGFATTDLLRLLKKR